MYLRVVGMLVGCLVLSGCSRELYTVTLEPRGNGLHRRIECWTDSPATSVPPQIGGLPPARLEQIARAYGVPTPTTPEGRQAFEGVFETMPPDIGGFGRYRVQTTTLGSRHSYAERFQGEAPQEIAERYRRAADMVVGALAAWFRAEMKGDDRLEALDRFVRGPFRNDLANAGHLLMDWWLHDATTDRQSDALVRVALYLEGRGYDPALLQALHRHSSSAVELLRRRAAREMGVPDDAPIPESLGFLGLDRVEASWTAFLEGWADRPRAGPEEGSASEAFKDAIFRALIATPTGTQPIQRLRVSLACPVKPTSTNGTWSVEDRRVEWEWASFSRLGNPLLRHAEWCVPDEAAQQRHFGRVVLAGEELGEYVAWRTSLTDDQGRRWDALLATLEAKVDAVAALSAFGTPEDAGWIAGGQKVLGRALAGR